MTNGRYCSHLSLSVSLSLSLSLSLFSKHHFCSALLTWLSTRFYVLLTKLNCSATVHILPCRSDVWRVYCLCITSDEEYPCVWALSVSTARWSVGCKGNRSVPSLFSLLFLSQWLHSLKSLKPRVWGHGSLNSLGFCKMCFGNWWRSICFCPMMSSQCGKTDLKSLELLYVRFFPPPSSLLASLPPLPPTITGE